MPLMPNQGLLAIAFLEATAILILFVLYLLLYRDFPARFFRFWIAGWTLYSLYGASRVLHEWQGGVVSRFLMRELFFAATVLFVAFVLEYTGRGRRVSLLGLPAGLVAVGLAVETFWFSGSGAAEWVLAVSQSALYLAAAWLLWRHVRLQKGYGAALLAAALVLRGLHALDQADWGVQVPSLIRASLDGLLELGLGVFMAVLVLEAARVRTDDLNEKLRRLTLITAAATQTFKVEEVLRGVLHHLVESLGVSHGLVRLLDGDGDDRALVIRAAVGFTEGFLKQNARIPASDPWARKVLEQRSPFLAYVQVADPEVRKWMEAEKLSALVLVRLPGKEAPLGLLGIGSTARRVFHDDEVHFLVNVANLLGLTIQNVWLFEQVANARGQWVSTFDSIGDPILVHDQQFRILRANCAVADALGSTPILLVGRPVWEVFRRGEARWAKCPYCEGAAGQADGPDPTFGGYFLVSTSEFHGPSGGQRGTIHVLKDITDRQKAEEKYRTLFENVQEGVFISTPEGRFLDFNDTFLRLVGFGSREELLQVDIASTLYVKPSDRERLKKLLREDGAVTNFEFQMRRRDGEVRTLTESSFATRDPSGQVIAYQGFVLDITEHKRAEQEIRRRNRELMVLNSIAQTLSQSLCLDELLGRALCQLVELFGVDLGAVYLLDEKTGVVKRSAAVGFHSNYAQHFPPTVMPAELVQHIRKVRATVLPAQSLPLPAVFRDLQQREKIQVSYLIVLWSKDRIMGGLVLACRAAREFSAAELNLLTAVGNQIAATIEKDLLLEETRLAYEDLRRTQEKLLQSEKMVAVGQLISGVAHELNNPLTAILGYSQLLASSEPISPRGAEYVDKLFKQAQRTYRIVQNLLSFTRQHKPERFPVRLNQILEDTLTLREYDLKLNNIRVHRDLDQSLPIVPADAHQLQQVFLNILNNAVDAILEQGDRGEIWVRTSVEDGRLKVEFTDSGPGVQDPLRVFDPFYTTKPVGKGTGLGLSICYGIIKEHGGEITVGNSPPRGATFCISLPMLPVAPVPEAVLVSSNDAAVCGRILLVDDEEAVLELEQEILKGRCLSVQAARSGREALEVLEQETVEVVVTDLKMPGEVTGRDLYRWIQRHRPELASHVVFTVSDTRTEELRALLQESGCSYVQKPFHVDEFLRVIRQMLPQTDSSAAKR